MCATCFWSAELSRPGPPIWCSHRIWNGWLSEPACKGAAYELDTRPQTADEAIDGKR